MFAKFRFFEPVNIQFPNFEFLSRKSACVVKYFSKNTGYLTSNCGVYMGWFEHMVYAASLDFKYVIDRQDLRQLVGV